MKFTRALFATFVATLGILTLPAHADNLEVTITSPPEGFSCFINEDFPVQSRVADVTGAAVKDVTVRWSATSGSYIDPEGASAVYIACDYPSPGQFFVIATAYRDQKMIASARISSQPTAKAAAPAHGLVFAAVPATPAALPAAEAEAEYFKQFWRHRIGHSDVPGTPAFIHEIYAAEHAEDRDSRVKHFKNALAMRPADPSSIVLEFRLAILLGQNVDQKHNQPTHPEEAQAIAEHIVATYDHKVYYRDTSIGESESTEYMVPRAAIWASSYATAILKDPIKARKYATAAMDAFYWTHQKRKAAWLAEPKPSSEPSPFDWRPGQAEANIKRWEERQAQAKANDLLGSYAEGFCDAAVNVYINAHAANPRDNSRILQEIQTKYADSQLASAAKKRLDKEAATARP